MAIQVTQEKKNRQPSDEIYDSSYFAKHCQFYDSIILYYQKLLQTLEKLPSEGRIREPVLEALNSTNKLLYGHELKSIELMSLKFQFGVTERNKLRIKREELFNISMQCRTKIVEKGFELYKKCKQPGPIESALLKKAERLLKIWPLIYLSHEVYNPNHPSNQNFLININKINEINNKYKKIFGNKLQSEFQVEALSGDEKGGDKLASDRIDLPDENKNLPLLSTNKQDSSASVVDEDKKNHPQAKLDKKIRQQTVGLKAMLDAYEICSKALINILAENNIISKIEKIKTHINNLELQMEIARSKKCNLDRIKEFEDKCEQLKQNVSVIQASIMDSVSSDKVDQPKLSENTKVLIKSNKDEKNKRAKGKSKKKKNVIRKSKKLKQRTVVKPKETKEITPSSNDTINQDEITRQGRLSIQLSPDFKQQEPLKIAITHSMPESVLVENLTLQNQKEKEKSSLEKVTPSYQPKKSLNKEKKQVRFSSNISSAIDVIEIKDPDLGLQSNGMPKKNTHKEPIILPRRGLDFPAVSNPYESKSLVPLMAQFGIMKRKLTQPVYTKFPHNFTIDSLDVILTPQKRRALNEIAKLATELEKHQIPLLMKGSFVAECLYWLLAGRKFSAVNINVEIPLQKGMDIEKFLEKISLTNREFKFMQSNKIIYGFREFYSIDKESSEIIILIKYPGVTKTYNSFYLTEFPLKIGVDSSGSIRFSAVKTLEPIVEKSIKASLFPVELQELPPKKNNNIRNFIPRLAKYMSMCQEAGIELDYYYDLLGRIKINFSPVNIDNYLKSYLTSLFEDGSVYFIEPDFNARNIIATIVLKRLLSLPIHMASPFQFSMEHLKMILTPEKERALQKLAKLEIELNKCDISLNILGGSIVEFLFWLLANKKFPAKDIDAEIHLPTGMSTIQLLEKVPLTSSCFGFNQVYFGDGFDNFSSTSEESVNIDIVVKDFTYVANENPFYLTDIPTKVRTNSNGIILFSCQKELDPTIEKDIKSSKFPVELPNLKVKNNIRNFIPRLAKYINMCEEDGIELSYYYYEPSIKVRISLPSDKLDNYLKYYFNDVFKSSSKFLLQHHFYGMKKMLEEGNFIQPSMKKIIIPFCAVYLSRFYTGSSDNFENYAAAASNLTKILQLYFETSTVGIDGVETDLNFNNFPTIIHFLSGLELEKITPIEIHECLLRLKKIIPLLTSSVNVTVAPISGNVQGFWSNLAKQLSGSSSSALIVEDYKTLSMET